ncbi:hypothetical protein LBMAG33_2240 [Candidatus Levyibacteriota bacterium]|nr:oligosaccharide repeat unit polymerase [Candidatus Levybacteria bacterium]GDX61914.1 hypothetical protein LBMAG33_2240 [Candidatus Levybacteria bacterium]
MFSFAFLITLYSYTIFFIGIIGLLYKNVIVSISLFYSFIAIYLFLKKKLYILSLKINSKIEVLFISIISLQALINIIGALGPELSFDSLWYHLTLPKLYLLNNRIMFIPGGLLYYSAMPKLSEMIYLGILAIKSEVFVKICHYFFGIFSIIALFNFSKKIYSRTISLIIVTIFYSNLVVAWESITSYIDLIRTFYEILAFISFYNWIEYKNKRWLVYSAILLGSAISVKIISFFSLIIYFILIIVNFINHKSSIYNLFINLFIYIFIALIIPLPWFIFSYINTGNLIYPFFNLLNHAILIDLPSSFVNFIYKIILLFLRSPDPISPLYFIFIPLIFIYKSKNKNIIYFYIYAFIALLACILTSSTGGSRFLMPYLPIWTLIIGDVIQNIYNIKFKKFIIIIIIIFSFISVPYRFIANIRFIPVILGLESKNNFLKNNLNFNFGDFYDIDGYLDKKINYNDSVLIYDIHNLYYIDFPYIHESWLKKNDKYNFIISRSVIFPLNLDKNKWKLIYRNFKSNVILYGKIYDN